MKKRLLSLAMAVTLMLSLILAISVPAKASGGVLQKMDSAAATWPDGSVYVDGWDDGCSTCYGFLRELHRYVFGTGLPTAWAVSTARFTSTTNVTEIGHLENYSVSQLKGLLAKSKPGDTIIASNGKTNHGAMIHSVGSEGEAVTVYDANWTTKGSQPLIAVHRYWTAANIQKSKPVAVTLYRATNYNEIDGTSQPANPTAVLSIDKPSLLKGESLTFHFSGYNTSGTYTLGIYYGSDRIDTVTVTESTYTRTFDQAGLYSAYMTSYNSAGIADSNWVNWEVKQTTAQLSVNKTAALIGEELTFNFSGNNSNEYTFGIYKDNKRIDTVTVKGNTYTRKFNETGKYSAYMTAYSYGDFADSNWVNWEVKQTTAQLSVDKTSALVGEELTFNFSGNNSNEYTFGIYKDNKRIDTVTVKGNTYTRKFNEAGKYSAYMTAYSYANLADSNWINWEIQPVEATDAIGQTISPVPVDPIVTPIPSTTGVHFPRQATYTQGQFTDVPPEQWFTNNVADAFAFGLMKGKSATSFVPYGDVTVAEAITMAARIHSIYTTGSENFVASGPWYQVYLDYAYQNGIITKAYYNSDVNQKATRAQFAEIFANALPADGLSPMNSVADNAIPDVKMSASYAASVYKLYRAGILAGGNAKGTFSPGTFITRAECAAIVSRMAESNNRVTFTLN